MQRQQLKQARRWVFKIGSALLTDNGQGLDREALQQWVNQIAAIRRNGADVIVVSSGAVAEGMKRLQLPGRPDTIHELQAAAAVGQMGLVQAWEHAFQQQQLHTAQVLLTHDDLSNRKRYLNARSTLLTLLEMGVVPVVNENDTVVTDEICFGDNDTLAALVANLVSADVLLILTDQNGLFDTDPRDNPDARLIQEASADDERLVKMATGSKSGLGRGGMVTKVRAAQLAARSGTTTVIAGGRVPDIITRVAEGGEEGTLLTARQTVDSARKQWLAGHLKTRGQLMLDAGAVKWVTERGSSLLPVGVKAVSGRFLRGEAVACVDENGQQVAIGLVNYDADDAARLCGVKTADIQAVLGFVNEEELIHRDNLVVTR